jgi:hypothetical protein
MARPRVISFTDMGLYISTNEHRDRWGVSRNSHLENVCISLEYTFPFTVSFVSEGSIRNGWTAGRSMNTPQASAILDTVFPKSSRKYSTWWQKWHNLRPAVLFAFHCYTKGEYSGRVGFEARQILYPTLFRHTHTHRYDGWVDWQTDGLDILH